MSLDSDAVASRLDLPASAIRSNQPWKPESYGIEEVIDDDRKGKAKDLFWLWMAANLGLIAVVYGAIMAAMSLDPLQAIIVGIVAAIGSFIPVGILSVAGKKGGEPMLALSRRVFGNRYNKGPALASWLSLVGWETITAVVAAEAVLAIFGSGLQHGERTAVAVLILAAIVAISLLASRLGHATIMVIQTITAWVFGLATIAMAVLIASRISLSPTHPAHAAPFGMLLAAGSVIAASGGVSWVNVSADYSRYLPRSERSYKVAGFTALGAGIPFAALVIFGYFLAQSVTSLAQSADPIGAIRTILPAWATIPYLILAIAGLIAQMILGLYSSGLSLLALGVRLERSKTVLVDAALVIVAGAWIVSRPGSVLSTLVSLVELLAVPISAWAIVFAVGIANRKVWSKKPGPVSPGNWVALTSWLIGDLLGFAWTSSSVYTGPLAKGFIGQDGLGFAAGALVAGLTYLLFLLADKAKGSLS